MLLLWPGTWAAPGSSESLGPTPTLGEQGMGGELGCAGPEAAVSQLVPRTELLHDKPGWWHKVPGDIFLQRSFELLRGSRC